MSEIEVPIETVQEELHHRALHSEADPMIGRGALLSAFLAVLAAISALFAGRYANEAMILQMQSSDQWAYYQAKGIKSAIFEIRGQLLKDEKSIEKVNEYKKEQEEIKIEAMQKENESRDMLTLHENLSASVTLFQVAIGLTAIAVLARKRHFLNLAMVIALLGFIQMVKTFLKI